MPITYLDVPPGLPVEAKRKLVKDIYDALHEAYPFPDDVRIFMREWPANHSQPPHNILIALKEVYEFPIHAGNCIQQIQCRMTTNQRWILRSNGLDLELHLVHTSFSASFNADVLLLN